MSTFTKVLLVSLCFCLVLCSCTRREAGRKETFPVKGEVYVDGQPAGDLAVRCVGLKEVDATTPRSATYTKSDGKFEIATYERADGVPEGEYVLTFQWGKRNLMTMNYEGDKLKGRYSDPKRSQVRFKVEKGKPVDLKRIELTTK